MIRCFQHCYSNDYLALDGLYMLRFKDSKHRPQLQLDLARIYTIHTINKYYSQPCLYKSGLWVTISAMANDSNFTARNRAANNALCRVSWRVLSPHPCRRNLGCAHSARPQFWQSYSLLSVAWFSFFPLWPLIGSNIDRQGKVWSNRINAASQRHSKVIFISLRLALRNITRPLKLVHLYPIFSYGNLINCKFVSCDCSLDSEAGIPLPPP